MLLNSKCFTTTIWYLVAKSPNLVGGYWTVLWKCNKVSGPIFQIQSIILDFPDSSTGKESTCNAGDPSSIPESGRSTGEGIGYPLQYSWASPVAHMVKNLPAMWETWVRSQGWEDPLEEGTATHSSFLAWKIRMGREAWWATVQGVANSQTWLSD